MRPDVGDAAPRPRLFFYVQHLLGIGHLIAGRPRSPRRWPRRLRGARSWWAAILPPDLDVGDGGIVQLPPVKAGPDGFAALVTPDGAAFDATDGRARRDLLLERFRRLRARHPARSRPFRSAGGQMRFELLPLLDAARGRPAPPLIVSSVRDILQRRPPAGARGRDGGPGRAATSISSWSTAIRALSPLEDSFPEAAAFARQDRPTPGWSRPIRTGADRWPPTDSMSWCRSAAVRSAARCSKRRWRRGR